MLQAPSHLSRVCGHSHIKKFWLMQMQNESQTCENKSGLVASSSLPVSGSSAKSPESKQSPPRSSASPGMRTLLAGTSSNARPVRPLLPAGYGSVGRHTSIVTCAESLSPPVRPDQTYRSFRPSSPDFSSCKTKEVSNERVSAELDSDVSKSPSREDGFTPSTSLCGSACEDGGVDLVDITSNRAEQSNSTIVGLPSAKANSMDPVNLHLSMGSAVPGGHDNLSPLMKASSIMEDRPYICCNISASSLNVDDSCKGLDGSPSDSHSSDNDNSDSGTDDGSLQYARGDIPVARTIHLDKRARQLSEKSHGWSGLIPPDSGHDSGKGCQYPEHPCENPTAGNLEASAGDGNVRNSVLRICSLCGTSKTPLWRSGPHGPKSLCNACGIRFKKSKRFPGQTEACDYVTSPVVSPEVTKPPSRSLKRKQDTFLPYELSCPRDSGCIIPTSEATFRFQKRSRWPKLLVKSEIGAYRPELTGSSESCLTLNLQSPPSLSSRKLDLNPQTHSEFKKLANVEEPRPVGRVIAKDEEEAAVLLMYLSCGLVYA